MQFKAMTQEEIDLAGKAPLLPAGTYNFKIVDAKEDFSKNGNPMFVITLHIFNNHGSSKVKDYVTYSEKAPWIIANFCKAIGVSDKLLLGQLSDTDIMLKHGICEVDSDGQYNKVKRYIYDTNEIDHLAKSKVENAKFMDDPLPF